MPKIYDIDDVRLSAKVIGSGPPLLLVHGFPLNHTMWRDQIAYFQASHRVIAPDLRGFGDSGVTVGPVTMEQFADDLARLLDVLEITDPVHFCGHSMGGYIGWQFVQRYPDRTASLIGCDTRAIADSDEARETRHLTADRVLDEGPEFLAEGMTDKLFSDHTREHHPEIIADVQNMIRKTSPTGIAAAALGMAQRPDVSAFLSEISVPVLLIGGSEDAISSPQEMQTIAESLPNGTFIEVPSAGHMAPMEQPESVNAALASFLGVS